MPGPQGDHADHIHVGFQPLAGDSAKLTQHYNSVPKPGQWVKLIERLNQIDNPIVPTKPSAVLAEGALAVRRTAMATRIELSELQRLTEPAPRSWRPLPEPEFPGGPPAGAIKHPDQRRWTPTPIRLARRVRSRARRAPGAAIYFATSLPCVADDRSRRACRSRLDCRGRLRTQVRWGDGLRSRRHARVLQLGAAQPATRPACRHDPARASPLALPGSDWSLPDGISCSGRLRGRRVIDAAAAAAERSCRPRR